MGKTVSIYLDDEIIEWAKRKGKPLSRLVREALKREMEEEVEEGDYERFLKIFSRGLSEKGEKAWKEVLRERDRG